MIIEVIGSGEAFDSGVGNNSCLVQASGTPWLLVDCGYQIPERLWARNDYQKIGAIYLSHIHADHAFGVVPLLTRFYLEGRRERIVFLGHSGIESYVKKALQIGYPGIQEKFEFPIEFKTLTTRTPLAWRGIRLSVAPTVHSIKNYAVRIEEKASGASFCFSGDGEISPASLDLYQSADLLVHEAFTWKDEIPGHTNAKTVMETLAESRIQKIVLAHFDHNQREKLIKKIQKLPRISSTEIIAASPGMKFRI